MISNRHNTIILEDRRNSLNEKLSKREKKERKKEKKERKEKKKKSKSGGEAEDGHKKKKHHKRVNSIEVEEHTRSRSGSAQLPPTGLPNSILIDSNQPSTSRDNSFGAIQDSQVTDSLSESSFGVVIKSTASTESQSSFQEETTIQSTQESSQESSVRFSNQITEIPSQSSTEILEVGTRELSIHTNSTMGDNPEGSNEVLASPPQPAVQPGSLVEPEPDVEREPPIIYKDSVDVSRCASVEGTEDVWSCLISCSPVSRLSWSSTSSEESLLSSSSSSSYSFSCSTISSSSSSSYSSHKSSDSDHNNNWSSESLAAVQSFPTSSMHEPENNSVEVKNLQKETILLSDVEDSITEDASYCSAHSNLSTPVNGDPMTKANRWSFYLASEFSKPSSFSSIYSDRSRSVSVEPSPDVSRSTSKDLSSVSKSSNLEHDKSISRNEKPHAKDKSTNSKQKPSPKDTKNLSNFSSPSPERDENYKSKPFIKKKDKPNKIFELSPDDGICQTDSAYSSKRSSRISESSTGTRSRDNSVESSRIPDSILGPKERFNKEDKSRKFDKIEEAPTKDTKNINKNTKLKGRIEELEAIVNRKSLIADAAVSVNKADTKAEETKSMPMQNIKEKTDKKDIKTPKAPRRNSLISDVINKFNDKIAVTENQAATMANRKVKTKVEPKKNAISDTDKKSKTKSKEQLNKKSNTDSLNKNENLNSSSDGIVRNTSKRHVDKRRDKSSSKLKKSQILNENKLADNSSNTESTFKNDKQEKSLSVSKPKEKQGNVHVSNVDTKVQKESDAKNANNSIQNINIKNNVVIQSKDSSLEVNKACAQDDQIKLRQKKSKVDLDKSSNELIQKQVKNDKTSKDNSNTKNKNDSISSLSCDSSNSSKININKQSSNDLNSSSSNSTSVSSSKSKRPVSLNIESVPPDVQNVMKPKERRLPISASSPAIKASNFFTDEAKMTHHKKVENLTQNSNTKNQGSPNTSKPSPQTTQSTSSGSKPSQTTQSTSSDSKPSQTTQSTSSNSSSNTPKSGNTAQSNTSDTYHSMSYDSDFSQSTDSCLTRSETESSFGSTMSFGSSYYMLYVVDPIERPRTPEEYLSSLEGSPPPEDLGESVLRSDSTCSIDSMRTITPEPEYFEENTKAFRALRGLSHASSNDSLLTCLTHPLSSGSSGTILHESGSQSRSFVSTSLPMQTMDDSIDDLTIPQSTTNSTISRSQPVSPVGTPPPLLSRACSLESLSSFLKHLPRAPSPFSSISTFDLAHSSPSRGSVGTLASDRPPSTDSPIMFNVPGGSPRGSQDSLVLYRPLPRYSTHSGAHSASPEPGPAVLCYLGPARPYEPPVVYYYVLEQVGTATAASLPLYIL